MIRLSSAAVFMTLFGLAAASVDLVAQGRGTHPGRGGGGAGGGGGFRGAPGPAQSPASAPKAPAAGPSPVAQFKQSPVAQFKQSPVAQFTQSPVSSFKRAHDAPPPAPRSRHRFPGFRHQQTVIVASPFSYGYFSPYFSPYASPFYGAPVNSEPAYVTPPVVQGPVADQNDAELTVEVQRLSREIEALRAEQAARLSSQVPPQPPGPVQPATPTILVFRDGRRVEISNYAIVGQTLWVLDERVSTRIALSDLDLEATQHENHGRGVRFPLPEK